MSDNLYIPQRMDPFMKVSEILKIFKISRTAWYVWIREGFAPRGIRVTHRNTIWRESDVQELVQRVARGEKPAVTKRERPTKKPPSACPNNPPTTPSCGGAPANTRHNYMRPSRRRAHDGQAASQ